MKIQFEIDSLESVRKKINAKLSDFIVETALSVTKFDPIQLEKGIELTLDKIQSGISGIFQVNGFQVFIYIEDHLLHYDEALNSPAYARKVHLKECSSIKVMKSQGRYDRYVVTNKKDGIFHICTNVGGYRESDVRLYPCQTCLRELNYKGFYYINSKKEKDIFLNEFRFDEFLSSYSTMFKSLPNKKDKSGNLYKYTDDWKSISYNLKLEKNFTCEKCNVRLDDAKLLSLLHVHHKNGIKSDNSKDNLAVLCVDCHSKEYLHDFLHVSSIDRQTIQSLRRKQQNPFMIKPATDNDWKEILEFSDPATHGLIDHLIKIDFNKPEVGLDIQDENYAVVTNVCLAWPDHKVAIVEDLNLSSVETLEKLGWKVYDPVSGIKEIVKL